MILLALYLAGKLRLYYGRRAFWKLMVCAAPPFVAFYIAISRTVRSYLFVDRFCVDSPLFRLISLACK
jgi:hypothetical protein